MGTTVMATWYTDVAKWWKCYQPVLKKKVLAILAVINWYKSIHSILILYENQKYYFVHTSVYLFLQWLPSIFILNEFWKKQYVIGISGIYLRCI